MFPSLRHYTIVGCHHQKSNINSRDDFLNIFILGAAKPVAGDSPVALKKIGHTTRVIDWQLDSFKILAYNQINFLGGYHIEDIVRHYPQINYTLIKDWQTKPVLHSLLQA